MRFARVTTALAVATHGFAQSDGACSGTVTTVTIASTVYITQTTPALALPSSSDAGEQVVTVQATNFHTIVATAQGTSDAADSALTVAPLAASSSTDTTYMFYVTDGTTSWLNGVVPATTTNQIFVTSTMILTVVPSPATNSAEVVSRSQNPRFQLVGPSWDSVTNSSLLGWRHQSNISTLC